MIHLDRQLLDAHLLASMYVLFCLPQLWFVKLHSNPKSYIPKHVTVKIIVPGLFVLPEFISAVEEAQLLQVLIYILLYYTYHTPYIHVCIFWKNFSSLHAENSRHNHSTMHYFPPYHLLAISARVVMVWSLLISSHGKLASDEGGGKNTTSLFDNSPRYEEDGAHIYSCTT